MRSASAGSGNQGSVSDASVLVGTSHSSQSPGCLLDLGIQLSSIHLYVAFILNLKVFSRLDGLGYTEPNPQQLFIYIVCITQLCVRGVAGGDVIRKSECVITKLLTLTDDLATLSRYITAVHLSSSTQHGAAMFLYCCK